MADDGKKKYDTTRQKYEFLTVLFREENLIVRIDHIVSAYATEDDIFINMTDRKYHKVRRVSEKGIDQWPTLVGGLNGTLDPDE